MIVFGQKWLYSGKVVVIRAKAVVFGQSACTWVKVVVFVQNWLYSVKSGCIQAKDVLLG